MANATTRALVFVALCGCSSTQTAAVHPSHEPITQPQTLDAGITASGAEQDAEAPDAGSPTAPRDDVMNAGDAAPTVTAVMDATAPMDSTEIVVNGSSDLPPVESSSGPFAQAVDRALAPHAHELTECMRPIIPRQRRTYRVMIGADGHITERPPQSIAMSLRVQECMHVLLRSVVLSPAPPRAIPYDIAIEPAQDRVIPQRR